MIIDNKFIWIDGPLGCGKTLLIEKVLQSTGSKSLAAVRFRKGTRLRQTKEIKGGNEETRRYKCAGAEDTLLMDYPDKDDADITESFFCTGFLGSLFNAVYCEGELTNDLFPMDLNVYVLPPLADPAVLFESREVKITSKFMRDYLTHALGHVAPVMEKFSKSFDDCIDEVLERTGDQIEALPPVSIVKLTKQFEGLIKASVIVVNIRDDEERPAAKRLLDYIEKVGSTPGSIESASI
jgi:hypothetical protein